MSTKKLGPIVFFNFKLIRLFKIYGIVLYPFVFISLKKEDRGVRVVLKHELTHVYQVQSCGVLRFYLDYLFQYIKNLFKYKNHKEAYLNISYEIEAYRKQYSFPDNNDKLIIGESLYNDVFIKRKVG